MPREHCRERKQRKSKEKECREGKTLKYVDTLKLTRCFRGILLEYGKWGFLILKPRTGFLVLTILNPC